MSRFPSLAYVSITFLFLLLAGVQTYTHDACSDQTLEFGKDMHTSTFKANSGNCTKYKHTVRIAGVAGWTIFGSIYKHALGRHTYVEIADYVVENGKELIVKRERLTWNTGKEHFLLSSSKNCSVLILFQKNQDDEEETPREEYYEAIFARNTFDYHACPYPWKSFTGSLNVTNDDNYISCAIKVDVPAGNNIKGVIDKTPVTVTVYDSDEVFVGEPLLKWSKENSQPQEEFFSKTNSITIIYFNDHNASFHMQLTEHVKDCSCFPTSFSLPTDNSVISLKTPGFPRGGCLDIFCQTSVSTNAIVTRENNYHIEFILSHQTKNLTDTVQFNIGGTILDFKEFETHYENSFCFANTEPISFTYHTSKEQLKNWGGMNVSMKAIQMPPECVCPSVSSWSVDINIPKFCPEMDCPWTLITNADSLYSIEFNTPIFPEEGLMFAIEGVPRKYSYFGHGIFSPQDVAIEIKRGQTVRAWYKRNNFSTQESDTRLRIDIREKDCSCHEGPIQVPATGNVTFNSPNWPFHYCNDLSCRYEFIAPKDYIIKLKIHSFSIDEVKDALTLFDGAKIMDRLAGGGNVYAVPFATTGNVLTALFETDHEYTTRGFNATVFAEYNGEGSSSSSSSLFSLRWIIVAIVFICIVVSLTIGVVFYRRCVGSQYSTREFVMR